MTDDGEKKDKLYDPCFYDLKKKKTQPLYFMFFL